MHACKGFLKQLVITVVEAKRINSGYHYITALLSNLTNLKSLTFLGSKLFGNKMSSTNMNFYNCLFKGLTNF